MDHWNCPVPSQVTWENNPSPLNEMHIHQQNHWKDILFYWYQSYHWHQWTIGLTNRIRLCILDMGPKNLKTYLFREFINNGLIHY